MMSNPTSQNTTAAPRTIDSKDISSRTATQAPTGAIEIAIPNHKCDKDVKRLAKEYPNTIPNATGERKKASRFNIKAANINASEDTIKKTHYSPKSILAEGNARFLVRGFKLSIFASIMRLKAIAPFLAKNIATRIHSKIPHSGRPSAAIKALIMAKGKANTVC